MAREKLTPKQEEIKLLERLLEMKGYFADKFEQDIPQMIQNIRNDYPIENFCKFEEETARLHKSNVDLAKSVDSKRETIDQLNAAICSKIDAITALEEKRADGLLILLENWKACKNTQPAELYTSEEILRAKIQNSYPLTKIEKEYLIENI